MDLLGTEISDMNDVPEFLNELIPYRCPKCGHTRRFATLRELRQHLQRDHSYKMGCVKPHPRASIFNSPGKQSISQNQDGDQRFYDSKGDNRIGEKFRIDKENYYTRDAREDSPLLRTFKDETAMLEMELQKAKQTELANKAASLHNLSTSSINTDFRSSIDSIPTKFEPKIKTDRPHFHHLPVPTLQTNVLNFADSATLEMKTTPWNLPSNGLYSVPTTHASTSKPNVLPPDIQTGRKNITPSTLPLQNLQDSLNSEVMKSRFQHWATTDALYDTQDLLKQMEHEAESKCKQQREIIEQLVHGKCINIGPVSPIFV